MTYIKIIIGLVLWGVLFFYGGSSWLDAKREQACTSEVNKDEPNLAVVEKRCHQTAEHYMKSEEYGSASWFYLLAGEYEKNINEVESNITDDFYMNIGHSYLLKGDYEKAREIYEKYPWSMSADFHYADENIQPDFVILPKLYKDKKEHIAKGLAMWNEIYEPIGKIVEADNAYTLASDTENSKEQISALKKYLEYAQPYREKLSVEYIKKQKKLAHLYAYVSLEKESIAIYQKLLDVYDKNETTKYQEIDTVLIIARIYNSISDSNSSLEYYDKAIKLSLDVNDSDMLPYSIDSLYTNVADIYREMLQYQKAIDYHNKALKYIEKNDSKNYDELASVYTNIAEINYVEKKYKLSIENYEKAIALKKEALNNTEDYYREYIFSTLADLYSKQASNYTALKMTKKAQESKLAYVTFLEYEYETHYKLISSAYHKLALVDTNSSKSVEHELKAIKYIEHAVETDWGDTKEENNDMLYSYMEKLEEYLDNDNKDEVKSLELYLSHVDTFEKFEERIFGGEKSNHAVLAKSYNFIANAYKVSDVNKSKTYAEKSVGLIEKSIVDGDAIYEEKESANANSLDKYYADLWNIYGLENVDINSSIDDYFEFKKRAYKEGSAELVKAYETVGSFFMNHASFDKAIDYYKQALNEAVLKNKENENTYLIISDISTLKDIYLNKDMLERNKVVKSLNELIAWQKKNYDDNYTLAKSYEALGQVYGDSNNTKMLEESYHKAMGLYYTYIEEESESYGILASLRDLYEKLSIYYIEHNDKEKAIKNFEMFIDYTEKKFPDDKDELAANYKVLANLYALMKDKKMTKKYREKTKALEATLP